jgi:hypothetical protein
MFVVVVAYGGIQVKTWTIFRSAIKKNSGEKQKASQLWLVLL